MDVFIELGLLLLKDVLEILIRQVEEVVKNGVMLYVGGKLLESKGNFFELIILIYIMCDNLVYFEEFFGLVVQMYVVKDDDEVVKFVNDFYYGLGGVVFSQDIECVKCMVFWIEIGMVYINWLIDIVVELLFGGVKCLGFGCELLDLGIKEFVNQKLVVVCC